MDMQSFDSVTWKYSDVIEGKITAWTVAAVIHNTGT